MPERNDFFPGFYKLHRRLPEPVSQDLCQQLIKQRRKFGFIFRQKIIDKRDIHRQAYYRPDGMDAR